MVSLLTLTSTVGLVAIVCFSGCFAECPNGWLETLPNTCLKISTDRKTYHGARAACQSMGGQLVSLEDRARQAVTKGVLYYLNNHDKLWIGACRTSTSSPFYWSGYSRARLTVTDWGRGEPNNYRRDNENCVEMAEHRQWNDQNCGDRLRYICEKRL